MSLKDKEKRKEYNKQYKAANKQKVKDLDKKYYEKNKKDISERRKKWREDNPDKVREWKRKNETWRQNMPEKSVLKVKEYAKKYREENKDKRKEYERRRTAKKYGLSLYEYDNLRNSVSNCPICGCEMTNVSKCKSSKHLDHNHKTGKIRGIICNNCNLGIGHFKENIQSLENVIKYLRIHNEE